MASDSLTSASDEQSSWARWLVPSVCDLYFVALFCLLAFTNLSSRLLGDAGIGWHIRTGQLILSTHSVPRVDPFSATLNGHPWFAWEWLYDLLVGWLASTTGLNGVIVFTAFVIALTFSLAFRWLLHRGVNILVALVLVLLATSASMIHFFARPHVVSWLLTFVWFWVLDSSDAKCVAGRLDSADSIKKSSSQRFLWLLPTTMVLWVNLHGGFLIALVLLAIYWLSALWQWLRAGTDRIDDLLLKMAAARHFKKLTWVGVLGVAATLINPYGARLYIHIYRYLTNRFLMDHIDEFQSPNFHFVAQKCFAALLLLSVVALAGASARGKTISLSHGFILLFAVYSGLYASRNIPISSLLLIFVMGPQLSNALIGFRQFARATRHEISRFAQFLRKMQSIELDLRGHLWPLAAVAITCWALIHGGRLGSNLAINAHFDAKRFPVAAINYIEKENLPGPFFSPDSWGGYLIYRLYPQAKVVIDDRHDFYGESFLRSYLTTMHVEPGWEDFLRQHPAQCLVVPRGSALANILGESAQWKSVYGDDVAVLFTPGSRRAEDHSLAIHSRALP